MTTPDDDTTASDAVRRVFPRTHGVIDSRWSCPVCDSRIVHMRVAGRPRVYCTNACRQRAYRWRRDNSARLAASVDDPAERAHNGIRSHALRSRRDFVSRYSDQRQREVAVCGAFARPARLGQFVHTNFVANNTGFACRSCIRLIAIPNQTIDSSWPPPRPTWEQTLRRLSRAR
jgi:hypothetical protein